jgi:colanic acid/amylovoran biosynthesis glycosyltransferase
MAENRQLCILFVGYGKHGTTFLNSLVKGLTKAGLRVTLATFTKRHPPWLDQHSVQRLWTPPWVGNPLLRLLRLNWLMISRFSYKRVFWLWRQIKPTNSWLQKLKLMNRYLPFLRGDWDIIYFPWNSAAISYQGLYELGFPVVVSCRGAQVNITPHLPNQGNYISVLKDTLQSASAVHCVSEDIQQTILDMGVSHQKFTIIRPAVDPEFFTPHVHPPINQRFTIVTTGSLIWRKSFETLLAALKQLLEFGVNAELHIIGDGPERQNILFTINDLGLEDHVFLFGRLKPNQVRDRLQNGDTFVLSSLSEGISNAVLEAMSCGLPIITTDCGGMREAVTDGVEGYVVPIRDPQALAQAMKNLALDPYLCQQMGANARQRILEDFVLNNQISAFINLFKSTQNSIPKS